MIERYRKYKFLFTELVKRDFKIKYKRTILGILWSMLSPLLQLMVMALVFTQFFGRTVNHYIIYLFCGNLVFNFFKEATTNGMKALETNSKIFTKVNVPKYLFLLSKNVESVINFGLSLIIFFIFVAADGVPFTWKFPLLLYPICTLMIFNIGIGLILSALYMFFKDIQYLYNIFTMIVMYTSAIFYTLDAYSASAQMAFYINPVFCHIAYFRQIVLEGIIPSPMVHLLCLGYALVALFFGFFMYKKYNYRFIYYV